MVIEIPFDLVAEVRCFFGRLLASSNAYLSMRSVPARVKVLCCTTVSRSVPSKMRPPIDEYSPSVFSRTTQKSMSPCLRRARVDVQVEAAAHRDEQLPQRHVIGHAGKTAGAEEHGVVSADRREAVLGHHAPVPQAVFAAPGKLLPLERDAEPAAGRLEHAQALGHDLFSDAVAGDDGDLVALHRSVTFQNATFRPPFNFSISRASSGVAIERPSSSRIRRIFATCSALVFASVPRPSHRLSSRPTRTLPPITADIAATNIWLRPAPRTDQKYWSPNRRSAVRFMCITSSGCGPMPPRMPNTDWMNSGGFTSLRSRKCAAVYRWPMS